MAVVESDFADDGLFCRGGRLQRRTLGVLKSQHFMGNPASSACFPPKNSGRCSEFCENTATPPSTFGVALTWTAIISNGVAVTNGPSDFPTFEAVIHLKVPR
jgi:hypothetical protein